MIPLLFLTANQQPNGLPHQQRTEPHRLGDDATQQHNTTTYSCTMYEYSLSTGVGGGYSTQSPRRTQDPPTPSRPNTMRASDYYRYAPLLHRHAIQGSPPEAFSGGGVAREENPMTKSAQPKKKKGKAPPADDILMSTQPRKTKRT